MSPDTALRQIPRDAPGGSVCSRHRGGEDNDITVTACCPMRRVRRTVTGSPLYTLFYKGAPDKASCDIVPFSSSELSHGEFARLTCRGRSWKGGRRHIMNDEMCEKAECCTGVVAGAVHHLQKELMPGETATPMAIWSGRQAIRTVRRADGD